MKLRELLQHTSGLADYIRAPAFVEQLVAEPSRYFSPLQLTEFVRDEPLEFAPGSQYHYSDTDNIAAGLIEEEAERPVLRTAAAAADLRAAEDAGQQPAEHGQDAAALPARV